MRKRTYHWFVEPLDAHTNKVFARELSEEEDFLRGVRDNEGRRHNVWHCPNHLLSAFRRSRRDQALFFVIYSREGNGVMRFFSLQCQPKKRRVA